MLFNSRLYAGLAEGSVTVAFRHWKQPRAKVGSRHLTPVGLIKIDGVSPVHIDDIDEATARSAGCSSRDELVTELARYSDGDLYRIDFHHAGADPRDELRDRESISEGELQDLELRER